MFSFRRPPLTAEECAVLELGAAAPVGELESILARVSHVAARLVGPDAKETRPYQAYRLLKERGTEAIPAFQRLLTSENGPASLYACHGLRELGLTEMAHEGLRQLLEQEDDVTYISGCFPTNWIGDLARHWLNNPGESYF